jgi:hypothetical protein
VAWGQVKHKDQTRALSFEEFQPRAFKPSLYGNGMPSQFKPIGVASTHECFGHPNVGGTLLENGHLQLIHFVILQLIFNCK